MCLYSEALQFFFSGTKRFKPVAECHCPCTQCEIHGWDGRRVSSKETVPQPHWTSFGCTVKQGTSQSPHLTWMTDFTYTFVAEWTNAHSQSLRNILLKGYQRETKSIKECSRGTHGQVSIYLWPYSACVICTINIMVKTETLWHTMCYI